jgi:hypothetical protein
MGTFPLGGSPGDTWGISWPVFLVGYLSRLWRCSPWQS